ncbi:hypothetical protein KQI76_06880 [Amphibacillus sp. MSJ-3]|uniref:hypothetical protein n=1 Tax=Amphibacillus sp. MSJ-3 TaxID=2841505 RepID=UPI001C0EFCB2|nr:hypothetical protein [Amphibacillus sp. MSJ-3]MBU5594885.1 hypothetical protein [Amphibacillus sp. MSJ-3]
MNKEQRDKFYEELNKLILYNELELESASKITEETIEENKKLKERVEELKDKIVSFEVWYTLLEQQNKRYKQALEFYADLRNWRKTDTERINHSPSRIIADTGDKAREALN